MRIKLRRGLVVAAFVVLAGSAQAGSSTVAECLEGSDFIANAARARDYGMAREAFLAKLDDDLALIHAFPRELRWFAKDADDERFLLGSAQQVFDRPLTPEAHRVRFLDACLGRASI